MAKVKDHLCEEPRHFDNSYYMYIAAPKFLKPNICNWIHQKILGILDPLLSEWESAVVGHEHNDKGGIIHGTFIENSLSSSIIYAQVLVTTIILLLL